ncbi:DUF1456 family protein [Nibribacter ruber]|uniref:DUF1456 family protein n=1 Tax=Nibribacter ruber TaxID=2698458 RepID=A0A6P1P474_9BACT|nr:DUF1456 family protein [Nibribacter ruber]QHL89192.1 DUF1456 family protein [Nibribacter ruber]
MTNNDILKKLRVALQLRDDQIIDILKLVDFNVSKSELGAIFRKEDHPNYQPCGDQLLRNFLNGLVIHMRGPMEPKKGLSSEKAQRPSTSTSRDRDGGRDREDSRDREQSRDRNQPDDRRPFKDKR